MRDGMKTKRNSPKRKAPLYSINKSIGKKSVPRILSKYKSYSTAFSQKTTKKNKNSENTSNLYQTNTKSSFK
jgi:hypothetical protein